MQMMPHKMPGIVIHNLKDGTQNADDASQDGRAES